MAEKLNYKITPFNHTKTGDQLFNLQLADRVTMDSYKNIVSGLARVFGSKTGDGSYMYYWAKVGGFIFKKNPENNKVALEAILVGDIDTSKSNKVKAERVQKDSKLKVPDQSEWKDLPTRYFSTKEVAKLIREALGREFPNTKFSVRSSVYSGGSSIRVSYVDGEQQNRVKKVAHYFEGSDFDGMQDMKISRDSVPVYWEGNWYMGRMGADYVFVDREYSPKYSYELVSDIDLNANPNPTLEEQMENFFTKSRTGNRGDIRSRIERDDEYEFDIDQRSLNEYNFDNPLANQGITFTREILPNYLQRIIVKKPFKTPRKMDEESEKRKKELQLRAKARIRILELKN